MRDLTEARASALRDYCDLVTRRIWYLGRDGCHRSVLARASERLVSRTRRAPADEVALVAAVIDVAFYSRQAGRTLTAPSAAAHYLQVGAAKGLDPSPYFDTVWYATRHATNGLNPLVHYCTEGWKRGHAAGPQFDTAFYLSHNQDVWSVDANPLVHFIDSGLLEGRRPLCHRPASSFADWERNTIVDSTVFDAKFYRANLVGLDREDPSNGLGDPLGHYLNTGADLGLDPAADFDTAYYLEQVPEVAAAGMNPLIHFLTIGWRSGVSPKRGTSAERFIADTGCLVDEDQPLESSDGIDQRSLVAGGGYETWRRVFGVPTSTDLEQMRQASIEMESPPLISIVMPVYNPNPMHLREAIQSVKNQAYPFWELCISDDASTDPKVGVVLRHAQSSDERIRVHVRETNGNISANSNSALALATGEFVGLLDHDDLLTPDALYHNAVSILEDPEVDFLYSDEDSVDAEGRHGGQHFKSAWNEELLLRQNYINHFSVYRREVMQRVGGFREGFEGSQDHDLLLRVVAEVGGARVRHIPRVLYSWRQFDGSGTFSDQNLAQAEAARRRAVEDYLKATGRDATVERGPGGFNLIRERVTTTPLVSLLIPTKDQAPVLETCVESILQKTTWPNYEVLIIDNNSSEKATFDVFERLEKHDSVRVLEYAKPFNYSAINNFAAGHAEGSVLGLVNNDVEVIEPEWLTSMAVHAIRKEIGAVGAQLLYPDGRIQHSGVVAGLGWRSEGVAGHVHSLVERGEPGYFWRAQITHAYSAVTAACLLVERTKFDLVDGLDEENLTVAFNDVDLCLKLQAAGFINLYVAEALLYHHESLSRGADTEGPAFDRFKAETRFMEEKWGDTLRTDPYYNPNLNLDISKAAAFHGLAWPPRDRGGRQIGRGQRDVQGYVSQT